MLLGSETGGIRLFTKRGTIAVDKTDLFNCDLIAVGDTSLIQLSNVTSTSTGGGSQIVIESSSGVITAADITVDSLKIQSTGGSLSLRDVVAEQVLVRPTSAHALNSCPALPLQWCFRCGLC